MLLFFLLVIPLEFPATIGFVVPQDNFGITIRLKSLIITYLHFQRFQEIISAMYLWHCSVYKNYILHASPYLKKDYSITIHCLHIDEILSEFLLSSDSDIFKPNWISERYLDWLIDWIQFNAVSAIFQPCNGVKGTKKQTVDVVA